MIRSNKDIINNYNYKENNLWFSFMNDGYCDLDNNGYPCDVNFKIKKKYEMWKYQANMYKKAIDAGKISKGKILDIACGRGGGLSFLNDYYSFDELTGLDLNPNHIKIARQINKPKVNLLCGSITDITLNKNYYNVISCIEASNYFNPYEKFVRNVFKSLKKNGVYIHTTPYSESYLNIFKKIGFVLKKKIDITKNVRMACAISKMRFKNISIEISNVFANDEIRYINNTANYTIYVFKK